MYEKANNFQIHGGSFTEQHNYYGPNEMDKLLKYCHPGAAHDSALRESKDSCYPGTRTQHITDLTVWAASLGHEVRRLFSMRGAAGTGKTTIAQSCAEEIENLGLLGASFFFWRDSGIVDTAKLFPTIAFQLAQADGQYKSALERILRNNPSLPMAKMETQLRELIIRPLLELNQRGVPFRQRVVIIDGLDEAATPDAQAKIIILISQAVQTYGVQVPLFWAFFSRPERHIVNAFADHASFPWYWEVTLHAAQELDDEIRLYLQGYLHSGMVQRSKSIVGLSSGSISWPSEGDVDRLVKISARLFIYATTLARYIMDPKSYSPEKRLQEVFDFHEASKQTAIGTTATFNPLSELDAFYRMIMCRVPVDSLSTIQQIILLHYATGYLFEDRWGECNDSPAWTLANIAGVSLRELGDVLSHLNSVLVLKAFGPIKYFHHPDLPAQLARISFYHASFLEFLLDKVRSRELCILDQTQWSALAFRFVHLIKQMHEIDAAPAKDRIRLLRQLLTAVPEDDWRVFHLRDELYHAVLHPHLFKLCARADPRGSNGSQVLECLRSIDFNFFASLGHFVISPIELDGLLDQFPEDFKARIFSLHNSGVRFKLSAPPPQLGSPFHDIFEFIINNLDVARFAHEYEVEDELRVLWQFIEDYFRGSSKRTLSAFWCEIEKFLAAWFKRKAEQAKHLSGVSLLQWYTTEWIHGWGSLWPYGKGATRKVFELVLSLRDSSLDAILQEAQDPYRIIRAVLSAIDQRRNGDLIDIFSLDDAIQQSENDDFDPWNDYNRINEIHRLPRLHEGIRKFFCRCIREDKIDELFASLPLDSHLEYLVSLYEKEMTPCQLPYPMIADFGRPFSRLSFDHASSEALVGCYPERLQEGFEKLLVLEGSIRQLGTIYALVDGLITRPSAMKSLLSAFKLNTRTRVSTAISCLLGGQPDGTGIEQADKSIIVLLKLRERRVELIQTAFCYDRRFFDCLDEAFQEVIRHSPALCHPQLERGNEEERIRGFSFDVKGRQEWAKEILLKSIDLSEIEWLKDPVLPVKVDGLSSHNEYKATGVQAPGPPQPPPTTAIPSTETASLTVSGAEQVTNGRDSTEIMSKLDGSSSTKTKAKVFSRFKGLFKKQK